MEPANQHDNKSYIHDEFTGQLNKYFKNNLNVKIQQQDCKKESKLLSCSLK
jgi:hypothetical protein